MIICYDTVSPTFEGGVPADAEAILFYTDGIYANEAGARARFPALFAAKRAIGLTVRGRVDPGDDFEPGNWQGNAGQWTADSIAAGFWRPVIYGDGSDFDNLIFPSLEAQFGRPLAPPGPTRRFRTILANPDGDPTIPPKHDGKQYWWGSIQGSHAVDMDKSALRDDFFQTVTPPPPELPKETAMIAVGKLPDGRTELFVEDKNGVVWHTWQLPADKGGGWVGAEAGKRNAQWYSLGNPAQQPE